MFWSSRSQQARTRTWRAFVAVGLLVSVSATPAFAVGNLAPVAHAGPDQPGSIGRVLGFSANASHDPDGTVVSYAWTFGDGASAAGSYAAHAFAAQGTYTVTLTVTDDSGASSTDTAIAHICPDVQAIVDTTPTGGIAHLPACRYTTPILVNRSMALHGAEGTVFDGRLGVSSPRSATVLQVQAPNVSLSSIEIVNWSGWAVMSPFADTRLTHISTRESYPLHLSGARVVVRDSVFGCGDAYAYGEDATVERTSFSCNVYAYGPGFRGHDINAQGVQLRAPGGSLTNSTVGYLHAETSDANRPIVLSNISAREATLRGNFILQDSVVGGSSWNSLNALGPSSGTSVIERNVIRASSWGSSVMTWVDGANIVVRFNTFERQSDCCGNKTIRFEQNSQSNFFYLNNIYGALGEDYGFTNRFDTGSAGNYWASYAGTDSNADGIGDTPFFLQGSTASSDRYPLTAPYSRAPARVGFAPDPTLAPEALLDGGTILLPRDGLRLGVRYDLSFTNVTPGGSGYGYGCCTYVTYSLVAPDGSIVQARQTSTDYAHIGRINLTFPDVLVGLDGAWRLVREDNTTAVTFSPAQVRLAAISAPNPSGPHATAAVVMHNLTAYPGVNLSAGQPFDLTFRNLSVPAGSLLRLAGPDGSTVGPRSATYDRLWSGRANVTFPGFQPQLAGNWTLRDANDLVLQRVSVGMSASPSLPILVPTLGATEAASLEIPAAGASVGAQTLDLRLSADSGTVYPSAGSPDNYGPSNLTIQGNFLRPPTITVNASGGFVRSLRVELTPMNGTEVVNFTATWRGATHQASVRLAGLTSTLTALRSPNATMLTFGVRDAFGNPIPTAATRWFDGNGTLQASIAGDGSPGNGANGTYTFQTPNSVDIRFAYAEAGSNRTYARATFAQPTSNATGSVDLVAEALAVNGLSAPGNNASALLTVRNVGDSASGPFSIRFLVDGALVGERREETGVPAGANVTRSFSWNATSGTYALRAHVDVHGEVAETNESNNVASTSAAVRGADGNYHPVAIIQANLTATIDAPLMFDASLSDDPDGFVESYLWSFGDGTSASGARVAHQYSQPGLYNVTLTVVDNQGASDSDFTSVYTCVDAQARINAAAPFSVVVLPACIYTKNVTIEKPLTIRGAPGATFNGTFGQSWSWDAFHVNSSHVTVENFTIENYGVAFRVAPVNASAGPITLANIRLANLTVTAGHTFFHENYGYWWSGNSERKLEAIFIENVTARGCGTGSVSFRANNSSVVSFTGLPGTSCGGGQFSVTGTNLTLQDVALRTHSFHVNGADLDLRRVTVNVSGNYCCPSNSISTSGNTTSDGGQLIDSTFAGPISIYGPLRVANNTFSGTPSWCCATSYFNTAQSMLVERNRFESFTPVTLSGPNVIVRYNEWNSTQLRLDSTARSSLVYLNNFRNSPVQDHGEQSRFDTGAYGNYWSLYNGSDDDGNGIGDTPQHVSPSGALDRYPLITPFVPRNNVGGPNPTPAPNAIVDATTGSVLVPAGGLYRGAIADLTITNLALPERANVTLRSPEDFVATTVTYSGSGVINATFPSVSLTVAGTWSVVSANSTLVAFAVAPQPISAHPTDSVNDFAVGVALVVANRTDRAIFGVNASASDGYDAPIDTPEPPPPADSAFIRAFFRYPANANETQELHRSLLARAAVREWPLVVQGSGDAILSWATLESVAGSFDVELLDGATVIDMRQASSHSFVLSGERSMTIRVRETADVRLDAGAVFVTPDVRIGANLSVSGTVFNDGPLAAGNVTVRLELDDGRAFVVATNSSPLPSNGSAAFAFPPIPQTAAGVHTYVIRAQTSTAQQNVTNDAVSGSFFVSRYLVEVAPAEGVALVLQPGQTGVVEGVVRNIGNVNDTLNLTTGNVPAGWTATLNRTSIMLAPGQDATFSVTLSPPADAMMGALFVDARVTARSVADPSAFDAFVLNATLHVTRALALPDGWSIVSLPVSPANATVAAVFGAEIESIYRYDGVTYSTPATVRPGEGYWVLALGARNVSVVGVPVRNLSLDLHRGWNLLGGPVANTTLAGAPAGVSRTAFAWEPSGYVEQETLEPGRGYFVYASTAVRVPLAPSSATFEVKVPATASSAMVDEAFAIGLRFTAPSSAGDTVGVGVGPDATAGFDDRDLAKAPRPLASSYVRASMQGGPADAAGELHRSMLAPGERLVWSVDVARQDAAGPVTVSWRGSDIESVDPSYRVELVHGATRIDMRIASSYALTTLDPNARDVLFVEVTRVSSGGVCVLGVNGTCLVKSPAVTRP